MNNDLDSIIEKNENSLETGVSSYLVEPSNEPVSSGSLEELLEKTSEEALKEGSGEVSEEEISGEALEGDVRTGERSRRSKPRKAVEGKKEFVQDVWPEVYGSRQNRSILSWPAVAVEEHVLRVKDGEEKVLCLAVGKERIKGIIPFSETGIKPGPNKNANRAKLVKYLGQEISFIVIGIDFENEQFIASRKAALERLAKQMWPALEEGMVVTATARRVYENSVVVEFDGIEAYLPIYEISYGWVDEILDFVQPGDVFDVKIIELDRENKRVIVSVKALIPNPWPGAAKRYEKRGTYLGTVTGKTRYGIFVSLEPGVNALCRHLRTDRFKVERGDTVAVMVNQVKLNGGEGQISGNVVRVIRKKAIS